MKKSLLALAVLSAFTGIAAAQSSVTAFGVLDMSLRKVTNNSVSANYLATDGNASSRLGFRGIEDLGGGLKAGFWLEGALSPDNGTTAGQQWRRRSTASLLGGFGEVRLGRDYTPTFWNHTVYDPFGTNGVGSRLNVVPGSSTQVRSDNTIGYFLPELGGVFGQAQAATSEGAAGGVGKYTGFRVGYASGPLSVALATGSTTVAANTDEKATNLGGSYDLGVAKIFLQIHKSTDTSTTYKEVKSNMFGLTAPIGATTLKFSYNKTTGTTPQGADTLGGKQVAFGAVYDLSKRTALYGTYSKVTNDAAQKFTVGSGTNAVGKDSSGFEFGLRHSF